jgi:hypothetical protein
MDRLFLIPQRQEVFDMKGDVEVRTEKPNPGERPVEIRVAD